MPLCGRLAPSLDAPFRASVGHIALTKKIRCAGSELPSAGRKCEEKPEERSAVDKMRWTSAGRNEKGLNINRRTGGIPDLNLCLYWPQNCA